MIYVHDHAYINTSANKLFYYSQPLKMREKLMIYNPPIYIILLLGIYFLDKFDM